MCAPYKTVETYITTAGREPFIEWLEPLRDKESRARVRARLERIKLGIFGDCAPVGEGIFELRFFFGSGLRVYFGEYAGSIILLLCGGDKRTQNRDIQKAKECWKEFKERKNEINKKF